MENQETKENLLGLNGACIGENKFQPILCKGRELVFTPTCVELKFMI